MIDSVFVEGLLYGIMVLGVFITFRILDFPDLTVDGSFPFGAAVMASLLSAGANPLLALLLAFAGGVLAGCVTAAIHNYLKVPNLLAGIITMTGLWSINLRVMGDRANLNLLKVDTLQGQVQGLIEKVGVPHDWSLLVMFILVALAIKLLLDVFFRTDLGLTLGAMGNNQQVAVSAGVNPNTLKFIGVGLSNGLVALSGAFACQYMGYADVSLGQGIIVSGLASVLLGEFLFKTSRIYLITLKVLLGSILFRGLMYLARYAGDSVGLKPSDNRLITSAMIVVALAIPLLQKWYKTNKAAAGTLADGSSAKPGKEKTHA